MVVTNSYLACAVKDVAGPDCQVLCLAPPGLCPGHFDMTPAQVEHLRKAKQVFLFDFQAAFERSLTALGDPKPAVTAVHTDAGLCVPQTYMQVCEQICETLCEMDPNQADLYRQNLLAVNTRINRLSEDLQTRAQAWTQVPVITSVHQEAFATWLGCRVVATFSGSDMETVGGINRCLDAAKDAQVQAIVANLQEGTDLATALGKRLDVSVVVFSNFPARDFDSLLKANVAALQTGTAL